MLGRVWKCMGPSEALSFCTQQPGKHGYALVYVCLRVRVRGLRHAWAGVEVHGPLRGKNVFVHPTAM
jgi:hypothetical protein